MFISPVCENLSHVVSESTGYIVFILKMIMVGTYFPERTKVVFRYVMPLVGISLLSFLLDQGKLH
jgi:hypothetical protein